MVVEGFFVCLETEAPIEATDYYESGDAPVLDVDDAGDCAIAVRFYANEPLAP